MAYTSNHPAIPPNLSPESTYLHITTTPSASPQGIAYSLVSSSVQLKYIGPVGELQGEHIFEVTRAGLGDPVRRDGQFWLEVRGKVIENLKDLVGVKGVSVMDLRQRVKRDEL